MSVMEKMPAAVAVGVWDAEPADDGWRGVLLLDRRCDRAPS